MQSLNIIYLKWDSAFFKRKIGKVVLENVDENDIDRLYDLSKANNYDLIYIFSQCELPYIHRNITYHDKKNLYSKKVEASFDSNIYISEYSELVPTDDMIELAILSGDYSRFKLDISFSEKDFFSLYKTWITKSVNRSYADKVYVAEENDKIVGIITCKSDIHSCKIGLISVNERFQGKGIGKKLIQSCSDFACSLKNPTLNVETQSINKNANMFYLKNNFVFVKTTHIYHLKI